jgi:hypothetical protein
MYSYNLTDEQIDNMSLEELKEWKNITGMNLYSYYGRNDERLHETYKAIVKARDKYLSKLGGE